MRGEEGWSERVKEGGMRTMRERGEREGYEMKEWITSYSGTIY